jgi:hypothetical protein
MATVLEEYTTEEQFCVVCLLLAKQLNAKDIHKEVGKCLARKAVQNWVTNISVKTRLKWRSGIS